MIATGGTIASKALNETATIGYVPSAFGVEELLSEIPSLEGKIDLSAEQLLRKQSPDFTDEDVIKLAKRVNEVLCSDTDGVVITMGTDTMEEVAYFLNLTVRTSKPIVITGAVRPVGLISTDGPLNMLNAIYTAASDESIGKGVLVAMDDLIICARDVMKLSSFKTDTFGGGYYGIIGTIRDGVVSYYQQSVKAHTKDSEFDITQIEAPLPEVEIICMYQGCGDRLFLAALSCGVKGIVSSGFGGGAIHKEILERYRERPGEMPVLVRACGIPFGGCMGDYGHFDDEIGCIVSNDLSPKKARILLRLALTKTEDRDELIRIFGTY